MIKFFRRIRLKLLENGRLKNYFLYAFGEILLVVAGILIALQINNWNEDRKSRKKEELILREMMISLQKDSLAMKIYIDRIDLSTRSNKFLLTIPDYDDSLSTEFMNAIASIVLVPKTAGFEQLKSSGMDLINNDSLRQSIVNYYDGSLKNTQHKFQTNLGDYNAKVMLPFFYEHFKLEASDTSFKDIKYIPKSYPDLIKNPDYITTLTFKSIYNEQEKAGLKALEKEIHRLIKSIRNELGEM